MRTIKIEPFVQKLWHVCWNERQTFLKIFFSSESVFFSIVFFSLSKISESFGIIDDDIIYFVVNESMTANLKKNDQVECTIIEGDYIVGKSKYVYRCERLKKVDAQLRDLDMDRWFDAAPLETIEEDESEAENEDKAKMKFEAYKGKEPNEEYYDLPYVWDIPTFG